MINKLTSILFLTAFLYAGCQSNKLEIDTMRYESPELIQCHRIFGKNLKSIRELNEFILLTGEIDTTDEQPPIPVALVKIKGKEIYLERKSLNQEGQDIQEKYEGDGYQLEIKMHQNDNNKVMDPTFAGHFTIQKDDIKTSYKFEATSCDL